MGPPRALQFAIPLYNTNTVPIPFPTLLREGSEYDIVLIDSYNTTKYKTEHRYGTNAKRRRSNGGSGANILPLLSNQFQSVR